MKKEPAKKTEKKKEEAVSTAWKILSFPHTTEKSIGLIETENTLVFIVDKRANKTQIKRAVENAFDVKVEKVRTLITQKNKKKAFVKLNKKYPAGDVAIRMGII
ncbi:MAG: 50S ribosomal protein L23 [Candidatus Aenigmarchaeota archaeon]|nr:50S ribosomal protein L23 [Candidatus Aenigmarchaeota archaeon]